MPPLHILVLALLVLVTPLYSIAILLFNTEIPPRCRTIRALGSGVMVKASIIFGVGLVSFFTEGHGMGWMPLLLASLAAFAAYRIMQLEGVFNDPC